VFKSTAFRDSRLILANCCLFLGVTATAAPTTFNLTGTFQNGAYFGPGSQITVDPNVTSGVAIGISAANVTLVDASGAVLAAFTNADIGSSSTPPGWNIGICKSQADYPPGGPSASCSSYPIINIFLPVSLIGRYAGGPLCTTSVGGCLAPTFYRPDGITFEYLVSGFLLPSNVSGNLPRFAFSMQTSTLGSSAVAVDSSGNTYLTGSVTGNPFTATQGAYQLQNAGGNCPVGGGLGPPLPIPCANGFVTKLDASGSIVFATYLGGAGNAFPSSIAVDPTGNIYVAGTLSVPFDPTVGIFPVTAAAAFPAGFSFVSKLSPDGTQLLYSTLLPSIFLNSIAINPAGEVYFVGDSSYPSFAPTFPVTIGAYQTTPGDVIASTVIGKLNTAGSALVYATYLSGPASASSGSAITVDAAGNAIVSGVTEGSDFPATAGTFSTSDAAGRNGYIAKLSADGSRLIYATLLGPGSTGAVKVDSSGDVLVLCFSSASFPVTSPGFGAPVPVPPQGADDGFLVHLASDGSTVKSSIYIPFTAEFSPGGALDVDDAGNAYIGGYGNLQATPGAFQPSSSGSAQSVVVAKVAPDGTVEGATYTGATTANGAVSIAAESDGSLVVATPSRAVNLPNLASTTPSFFVLNFFPAVTVENSASFVSDAVAAGELVSIQGYGLGPVTGQVSMPVNSLGGVQVFFDSFPAPLTYAQANQINAQVPWEIAGQASTKLRVVYNGINMGNVAVPVTSASPGIFYVVNSDGRRNMLLRPARAGDLISIFGTGGGAMSPAGVDGGFWPLSIFSNLTEQVSVRVSGETAAVGYAGSAPTLSTGYFQINARLPSDLPSGQQTLVVTIGGVQSVATPLFIQ
jgi:uncharacterized protein (TIGR03437 family)